MAVRHSYERLSSEDSDSGECQVYIPEPNEQQLEVDESAYTLLEHISLEWPAQSITINDGFLFLGTNPDIKSSHNHTPSILRIDLNNSDFHNLKSIEEPTDQFINKIRYSNGIYALSDTHLSLFFDDLKLRKQTALNASYGLYIANNLVLAGTRDGSVVIYDLELNEQARHHLHNGPVESITLGDNLIISGSSDRTVIFSDFSGNLIKTINNNSDINAIDLFGTKLVYGDDKGIITLYDIRNENSERIEWHKTAISTLAWMNEDIFVSGSDEQVCIWDISLEDDSDYSKYLLFVHQGQRYYKDCCFMATNIITTSQDGLCLFLPISFTS